MSHQNDPCHIAVPDRNRITDFLSACVADIAMYARVLRESEGELGAVGRAHTHHAAAPGFLERGDCARDGGGATVRDAAPTIPGSIMADLPDACGCDAVGNIGGEGEHVLVVGDGVGGG